MTDNPIQTLKALRDAGEKVDPFANSSGVMVFARMAFKALPVIDQAIKLLEQYEKRLEIDPRHDYDGIDCRDETIRGLEQRLEARQVDVEGLKDNTVDALRALDTVALEAREYSRKCCHAGWLKQTNENIKTIHKALEAQPRTVDVERLTTIAQNGKRLVKDCLETVCDSRTSLPAEIDTIDMAFDQILNILTEKEEA